MAAFFRRGEPDPAHDLTMSRLRGFVYRVGAWLRRDAADAATAEEIAFHVDQQTRKHVSAGMSPADARTRALREFGGATYVREQVRDVRGSQTFYAVVQDARHAWRGLYRDPAFAAMAVLTLSVGIAVNSAMFGIVDRLLLRGPEHVQRPAQLSRLYLTLRDQSGNHNTSPFHSYALYTTARDRTSAFSSVAAYTNTAMRHGVGPDATVVTIGMVTADLFPLTGVRPARGRFFTAEEDRPPQGQDVVVLSHEYWDREFGGDPAAIGRGITLDGREFRVIGIAPRGFAGVERESVDGFIPLSARPPTGTAGWETSWGTSWVKVVGRLAVTREVAEEQVTAAVRGSYDGSSAAMSEAMVAALPISYGNDGAEPPELGVARVLAAVALLLAVIAAANVANLSLARAVRRRGELAVRVALGAGRARLIRLLVIECWVIAIVAAGLAIPLARVAEESIRTTLLPQMAWPEFTHDARMMGWTVLFALAAGTAVGLLVAIRASRGRTAALREGLAQDALMHTRLRTALQVGQLALSVVLLFGAGLFARSLSNVRGLDLGLEPDKVLAATVPLTHSEIHRPEDLVRWKVVEAQRFREMLARLRQVSSVAHASIAIGTPFYSTFRLRIEIPGRGPVTAGPTGPFANAVGSAYFETVGTRILRGRPFDESDAPNAERVVIVNEAMAERHWPGEDVLTKCVVIVEASTACARVVGVAANARQSKLRERPVMQYYIPYGQEAGISGAMLLIRPRGEVEPTIPVVRDILKRMAPDARIINIRLLQERLDPQIRPWRVGASLFGLFGAFATLVAALGLFSMVSYLVAQRTKELGIRVALGASRRRIVGGVLGAAVRTAAAGAALGASIAYTLAPRVQSLLFDNPARDTPLLVLVCAIAIATAILASLVPSIRASRADPLVALRSQ